MLSGCLKGTPLTLQLPKQWEINKMELKPVTSAFNTKDQLAIISTC